MLLFLSLVVPCCSSFSICYLMRIIIQKEGTGIEVISFSDGDIIMLMARNKLSL